MTTLPTTTCEITADWMTEALQGSGTIGPDVTVSSVHADPGAAGIGFMGEVAGIDVEYSGDAAGAPGRVVAKFPTASPEVRTLMHPTRVYEREHRFYEKIAKRSPVRTPDLYHVTCDVSDDPMSERYMLLLEDLGDLELGDQLAGVSPEQAEAALVGLARHHARFWNRSGLEDATFIPTINGPLNKAGQGIYNASLPGFKEVFSSALLPEMVPIAENYGLSHPNLLDRFAGMPHTLVHFDYRADNLFFDTSGGGAGSVVVIDWQSISIGGGASDVGYFLGQNLSIADRRAHEDELLHRYHDTLVAEGVTGYEFDQFFQDYRVAVVYGWVIPVFAVGSLDTSSERAMALWTAVLERIQDAIFHHDAQEFIG
ncbi:aminoglycoside phosphotransferase family protein [Ilumatobacter nonamiensis]|uniref:aminoglycoside phosphotransferase family protein n=1 Tax=Ilumatobacter nonamiensis TaxID=467093 RepID=UPI000345B0BC|nr:oxidoreductase family protein [Ilumatobacter nonamiensis]